MTDRASKYINNQISEDLKKGKSLFKDASDEELHKITEKSQEPREKLKAQLASSNRKWTDELIKREEREDQIEAAVKDLSPLIIAIIFASKFGNFLVKSFNFKPISLQLF